MQRRRRGAVTFHLEKKEKKSGIKGPVRLFFNRILLIFAAVVLGYALTTFGVQTVKMSGPSMSGTISDGDTLILNKAVYHFREIRRYDIVAIRRIGESGSCDIKRVVGLPGDEISLENGKLMINGKAAAFDFGTIGTVGRLQDPVRLGQNEYFVLGDFTESSEDSRFVNYGNIQKSEIRGRIRHRLFPAAERGRLK